ncbi:transcription factor bHLH95-like [Lotus japonicus]|uniref:transcription factor bHLH95-like n=1 Tax=Lotus japonicus TaxID=34305 RepID=UPI00259044EA|nr:transcription factor bHLH95-like [Lotus japonicus]
MALEGHDLNSGFLWKNRSWGSLPDFDDIGESSDKLGMKPQKKQGEGNGEEALVNKKRNRGGRREKNVVVDDGGKDDDEVHMWTERERRKKMRNMFDTLHALLPRLPSKPDKSTIIDKAVSYIKTLQQTLEKLEKQKKERLQPTVINSQWQQSYDLREGFILDMGSSNNLSSAMVGTGSSSNPSISSNLAYVQPMGFQTWSYQNIVLNVIGFEAQFSISTAKKKSTLTTIAFVLEKYKIEVISANIVCNGNTNVYLIIAQAKQDSYLFQDANSVAEIYKQAAGEIQLFIA